MTRTTSNALRAGGSVAGLAALALSGALLLSACSSSSPSTSASSSSSASSPSGTASGTPAASAANAEAMDAYRKCLAQHGVELPTFAGRTPGAGASRGPRPSGGAGGGGFPGMGGASPDAATQQAMEACASLRPQFDGRGGPGAGGGGGGDSTAYKAFTSCLKDHGVVLPTASPGASPGGARGLDTADPKAAKAYETCRALLPERSASPSATTG